MISDKKLAGCFDACHDDTACSSFNACTGQGKCWLKKLRDDGTTIKMGAANKKICDGCLIKRDCSSQCVGCTKTCWRFIKGRNCQAGVAALSLDRFDIATSVAGCMAACEAAGSDCAAFNLCASQNKCWLSLAFPSTHVDPIPLSIAFPNPNRLSQLPLALPSLGCSLPHTTATTTSDC